MIVALTGRAGSGKDTVADIIEEYIDYRHLNRISFAAGFKEKLAREMDCSMTLLEFLKRSRPEIRERLKKLGQEGRARDINCWVKPVLFRLGRNTAVINIITDLRFKNELEALRRCGQPLLVIKLERPDHKEDDIYELDDAEHINIYLINRTLEQLRREVITQVIPEIFHLL